MARLTIISGCPGVGKTTLARELARRQQYGVHLVTDDFYRYLSHRLDPSTPESKSQNTTVVRAFLRAAWAFLEGGYDVYLDGVVGPWWLDEISCQFSDFDYVILHADLETVLERTANRGRRTQASANSTVVRTMHKQFSELADHAQRTIDTSSKTTELIIAEYERRHASDAFCYCVPAASPGR